MVLLELTKMFAENALCMVRAVQYRSFNKGIYSAWASVQKRCVSSSADIPIKTNIPVPVPPRAAFHRLSTPTLVRSVILGTIFKRPWLYKPGLKFMKKIANSKSWLLDADRNPLVRAVLLPLIYKQFCAGRNKKEISETMASIKKMGYTGIILCYAREVTVDDGESIQSPTQSNDANTAQNIELWHQGNLKTLEAVEKGDYIGIK